MKLTVIDNDSAFAILPPTPPSLWQQFCARPCLFLANKLYSWRPKAPPDAEFGITIVCISNTYKERPELPEGDVLIHAGDLTTTGSLAELEITLKWLHTQPHPIKIVIAGKNDSYLDYFKRGSPAWAAGLEPDVNWGDIIYLHHDYVALQCPNGREVTIFGSPFSPRTTPSAGFQYPRGADIWAEVTDDVDIFVTHTPPWTHLDSLRGCPHLLNRMWRCPPRLVIFGGSIENWGAKYLHYDALQNAMEVMEHDGGGFFNLLRVIKGFLLAFLHPRRKAVTLLVNACYSEGMWSVGQRKPVIVTC
ncbi:uncharacterized protein N7515_005303 [Penicillium bovifimosum]|uniref:Calcineurin-like phosphoesterase domain-containing protein n=1 Tax=Penicillium bovifimosum TaxID=126998 RepID=A0A9W9GU34_9EURO|nr:uncharacterized protein N7515_005303 [Penicillium bovifimosum]KAJ5129264.1 hypothetical protein N7515_005303 [Penicillium bovifimosum]